MPENNDNQSDLGSGDRSRPLALADQDIHGYGFAAHPRIRDPDLDQELFGAAALSRPIYQERDVATNVKLVKLNNVAERTARALGGADGGAISSMAIAADLQRTRMRTEQAPAPATACRGNCADG